MSVLLGDLPLKELNDLFVGLFSHVVKVDGTSYPNAALMNMMNAFNCIIRRASDVRRLGGRCYQVDKNFNISTHPVFGKTRMVLMVVIKRSTKEGLKRHAPKV